MMKKTKMRSQITRVKRMLDLIFTVNNKVDFFSCECGDEV